jgi:hypothetical protein
MLVIDRRVEAMAKAQAFTAAVARDEVLLIAAYDRARDAYEESACTLAYPQMIFASRMCYRWYWRWIRQEETDTP